MPKWPLGKVQKDEVLLKLHTPGDESFVHPATGLGRGTRRSHWQSSRGSQALTKEACPLCP